MPTPLVNVLPVDLRAGTSGPRGATVEAAIDDRNAVLISLIAEVGLASVAKLRALPAMYEPYVHAPMTPLADWVAPARETESWQTIA